jgi:hypothetical protein
MSLSLTFNYDHLRSSLSYGQELDTLHIRLLAAI